MMIAPAVLDTDFANGLLRLLDEAEEPLAADETGR